MTMRYALRSLAKTPGFVVVAVVALGLGLGLSTTMFAVLDAVLHPYVAYRDPETLFTINWWFGRRNPMAPAELYRYLRDQTHSFEAVVPLAFSSGQIETPDGPVEVGVSLTSPRFFPLTGVTVEAGRVFNDGDGDQVVVMASGEWQQLFGTRRFTAGRHLTISGRSYTVVGLLPRGSIAQFIAPIGAEVEAGGLISGYLRPYVRLRPGITREQGAEELHTLAHLLTDRFAAADAPFAFDLSPQVRRRDEIRDLQKAMVGSALAVLLIACVNLAHLMLARGMAKRRELSLRMALGASRTAIVRQMFTECALITVGGAALGSVITLWGAWFLRNKMPPQVAWLGLVQPQLSGRVFTLGLAAAAVSAVLFGLLPAVRVTMSVDLSDPLKDDSGTTTGRVRQRYSPLVVGEVGLALVLLMGGGLLLRTVVQLQSEQRGTDSRTLYYAFIMVPGSGNSFVAPPSGAVWRRDVLSAIRGVPGVADVAMATSQGAVRGTIGAERTDDSVRVITAQRFEVVSPNYVTVLGQPILRGRNFEPGDASGDGVAIIDPVAAQRLYPHRDPVGRMIQLGAPGSTAPWVPIIGVMRSPRVLESRDTYTPNPVILVSRADSGGRVGLLIRTRSPDATLSARIGNALRAVPGAVRTFVVPYDYSRQAELVSRTFLSRVFVSMGAVALGLAALGLYGVLAYAVTRRMREFAVRVALGAEQRGLIRLVLHDGLVMLLAGIGAGAFGALAAARLLDAVLIAVLPSDVISLVLSEILLFAAGFAAAIGPARRAAKANPMDILRAV